MKQGGFARVMLVLLGLLLILWGCALLTLRAVGKPAFATITHIRREGGERTDGKPGRYTYNISYSFTLPDGREIDGISKQIGNGVYLKADGKSTTQIRYLKAFPHLNAMQKDIEGIGCLIYIGAGGIVIFLACRSRGIRSKE